MPRRVRLDAVDHVIVEARPDCATRVAWFYDDILGLEQRRRLDDTGAVLRFRSDRLELRVQLVDSPYIHPADTRIHLSVPALDDVTDLLDDNKYEYGWIRGLQFTDRQVVMLDPAGHRIAVRQLWSQVY